MKIAVISCWKYRDCWQPFFALFRKFWPDCPHELTLVTDEHHYIPLPDVRIFDNQGGTWTEVLHAYASEQQEPVLLLQEDMFFSAPVDPYKIYRAIDRMEHMQAGCVRLYPCPGGETEIGDPEFAAIAPGVRYRISLQCGLWNPEYLAEVCEAVGPGSARDFELTGTIESNGFPNPILGWKRDVKPWAVQYICTSVISGLWNPDAKRLCDEHGIEVDWSMRGFMKQASSG